MKLGKCGKWFIGLLCICVVLVSATPVWAGNADIGNNPSVTDEITTANDAKATATDDSITESSINANAKGKNVTEIGTNANAEGENATAVGTYANAVGKNVTAVGTYANATGENTTAIGAHATATGKNATAIGDNAKATAENSVALGAGSETGNRKNTVSVGAPGAERQITNVADGVAPTDAVNVRQLDRLSLRLDRVGALAAAMSGLAPLAYKADEPTQGSIATGMYSGETAVAGGLYHYTHEDVLLNAAFAICGSEKMGRMGVSFRFPKGKDKSVTEAPITPSSPAAPVNPATPTETQEVEPVAVIPETILPAHQATDAAAADTEVKG